MEKDIEVNQSSYLLACFGEHHLRQSAIIIQKHLVQRSEETLIRSSPLGLIIVFHKSQEIIGSGGCRYRVA